MSTLQYHRVCTGQIIQIKLNALQIILTIFYRYPGKIKENLHCCHAYLPVGVAYLLKHQPSLIAPAVLAFCHRDMLDVKACSVMK